MNNHELLISDNLLFRKYINNVKGLIEAGLLHKDNKDIAKIYAIRIIVDEICNEILKDDNNNSR